MGDNKQCPYLDLPEHMIRELWKSQGPPGISIRRTGRGYQLRWRDQFEDGTVKQNGPTVGSWEEALELGKLVVRKKAAGEIYRAGRVKRVPTLGDVKQAYLVGLEGHLAANTVRLKEIAIRYFIDMVGGESTLITDLRTKHMDDYRQHLLQMGTMSGRSINQRLNHCENWWDEVFRLYVREIPALAPPIKRRVNEAQTVGADKPVLGWSAVDLALPELSGEKPIVDKNGRTFFRKLGMGRKLAHRAFLIGRGTALRVSQCCALKWEDINLNRQLIHVHRACKSKSEKKGRFIAMPDWLAEELAGWERISEWPVSVRHTASSHFGHTKASRNPCSKGDVHWCGENEHRVRAISTQVHDAWKRVGIPREYWGRRPFHLLRHTFSTSLAGRLKRDGVELISLSPIQVAEYHLGHEQVLHGVYANIWTAYEHDLRKAALGFPKPGSKESGEGTVTDLRIWKATGT